MYLWNTVANGSGRRAFELFYNIHLFGHVTKTMKVTSPSEKLWREKVAKPAIESGTSLFM